MEKNRTGKYLKYALGEIILVVLGILIALQINTWNEQRKDRIKEQVILKQLHEDYQVNLAQLEDKIQTRDKMLISAAQLLDAFDEPTDIHRDSLIKDLAIIRNDPTFDPIQSDIASTENLRLIRNDKLKRLLSNWSSDVVGVLEIEKIWTKLVNEQYMPVISELGIGRDINNSYINDFDHNWLLDKNTNSLKVEIGASKLSTTLNEILENRKLESLVSESLVLSKGANIQSEALSLRMLEILKLLEDGIKK